MLPPILFSSKQASVIFRSVSLYRFISLDFQPCRFEIKYKTMNPYTAISNKSLTFVRQMAGHAKWQNVKHVKEAKDRQKHNMCNKYYRLISIAIREKGPDPKQNIKLAQLIESARKSNVPKSTLESAFKKGENIKVKGGSMEIYGPGGTYFIVEYETDNHSIIRHDIKVVCKKYNVNVVPGEGRWRAVYEQKGFIKAVKQCNGEPINEENSLDAAILAGAEEVQTETDENGESFLEFICASNDLHLVKKELEQQFEIEEAYIGYKPTVTVKLPELEMNVAEKLLEELENLDEVVRIYENVQ